MEKEKKVYTPPIAEQILLAPSEEITTYSDTQGDEWAMAGWENKWKSLSTVQAKGQWVWNEDGTIEKG